jgi:hypothetical protein
MIWHASVRRREQGPDKCLGVMERCNGGFQSYGIRCQA